MEPTIGELALSRIDHEIDRFLGYRAAAGLGDDPEAIHQMRVSARRLRGILRAFAPMLQAPLVNLEPRLAWIAASLGAVRDVDVVIERFPEFQTKLAWERRRRLKLLRSDLRSGRFEELANGLGKKQILSGSALAAEPAKETAPDLVRRHYRRIRRLGEFDRHSAPEQVHRLRKRAKRLRYVADCFEPLYGKAAARFIEALKGLQDLLGRYQDNVVAGTILADLGCETELPPPSGCGISEALEALHRRWKRLSRKMKRERRRLDSVKTGEKGSGRAIIGIDPPKLSP